MIELLRSNDQVIVSFAGALLTDVKIAHHVADQHLSVLDGSMGTIQMRVLVADDHAGDARQVLADGGLEQHLVR